MRKTKRFTPAVLNRFTRQGRGTGTHTDYRAWHLVSRGDPSSRGRSHLLYWRGRLRDLLSDGELAAQLFATMLPNMDDCLEQFPLSIADAPHPLAAYGEHSPFDLFPGTQEIAAELGIRHPVLREKGQTVPWVATSDLLLVLKPPHGPRHLLALAFKPNDWGTRERTCQLLQLEQEYWKRRGVPWLLITPAQSDPSTVLTLRRTACWALAAEVPQALRKLACTITKKHPYASVTALLHQLQLHTHCMTTAQCALWQAIWKGELPVDLRRGWRPHVPLKHLSYDEFTALNPIASRRSAWI